MNTHKIQREFVNDIEKSAYFERLAFNAFIDKFGLWKADNYDIYITDISSTSPYDVIITKKDDNGKDIGRLIIEIKIRDKEYSSWVYEGKKHNSLTKIKNIDPDYNKIIYINFTPTGTIVWDIDKIIDKYKLERMEMNRVTSHSRSDKVDKRIYLLKEEDGKKWNYIWDEKAEWKDKIKEEDKKKMEEFEEKNDKMWKWLMGKQKA